MSKADGWEKKKNHFEWIKSGPTFRAEIDKHIGTVGRSFFWNVYPLPWLDHINENGRCAPLGKGSGWTLAEAKRDADAIIRKWIEGADK